MSFFHKRVFCNNEPSYKRETKSVKCRGVHINRTKWIVRNSTKQKTLCVYYFLIKRKKLFGQPNTIDKIYFLAIFMQLVRRFDSM